MLRSVLKSLLHNVFVVAVGFVVALLGAGIDHLLGIADFKCALADGLGCAFIAPGFLLRTWAAFHFYMRGMDVIVLHAQKHLITTGPYRFSRNPLYLGGNVFIFCGASLILGTPGGLALIILHLPLVDFMIQREERQLQETFGDAWWEYAQRTRRWM
jgi:protein-S-isoprenylcysteine O-methyltransferase Ste14